MTSCRTKAETKMSRRGNCSGEKAVYALYRMKFYFRKFWFGLLLFTMSGLAQNLLQAETPPTADQVIQKAVARTQQSERSAVPDFSYRKLTMTEELDGAGNVKERREKVMKFHTATAFPTQACFR
jgi:hypothetical protein